MSSTRTSTARPELAVLGAAVVAAVAVPSFMRGGLDASSRSVFIALAGVSLLAATAVDGAAALRAARSTTALALAGLGVVSVASAAWTVAGPAAAARWGLVILGYAAMVIAGRTLCAEVGPWPFAAGIAALAVVEAVIGLDAVARHALPDAERLGTVWRPGGTFEYQPALALLEVAALPALTHAIASRRMPVAVAGGAAAVLAGGALGLSDSRLGLALAAIVLAWLIAARPGSAQRAPASACAGLAVLGGVAARVILGASVGPGTAGAGTAGTLEVLAVALASGVAWPALRSLRRAPARRGRALPCSIAAVALIAAMFAISSAPSGQGRAREHRRGRPASVAHRHPTDLFHGRTHEWLAAIQTWLDRPVLGAGADAYFDASRRHQRIAVSRYAHDLPLELAAELGLPGLGLALAVYAGTGRTLAATRRAPAWWLLAPLVGLFLLSNLLDWTWHLAGLGAAWAGATGALQAVSSSQPDGSRNGRRVTA